MKKLILFWFIVGLSPVVNAQIANLTDSNYFSTLSNSKKLIIIDFYYDGCKLCIAMKPVMDSLALENAEIVTVYKMNIFKTTIYRTLGIDEFPTYLFYKNSVKLLAQSGITSKAELKKLVETYK